MKLLIDNLNSITGWTASGGSTSIFGLNELKNSIAGNNDNSLILYFNGVDSYCTKTLTSIDVTDYNTLTFYVQSINKSNNLFTKWSDFSYKIDINSADSFYLPIYEGFSVVKLDISDITEINKIKITSLHSDEDYIVISYMVVSSDNIPLDLFEGIKEQLEYEIENNFSKKFPVGIISTTAGDSSITFVSDIPYIDRYVGIMITDDVNTEYHIIEKRTDKTFTFNTLYDGKIIKNTFIDANVYLYIPVVFGRRQIEIVLPSITIWSFEPEKIDVETDLDNILDTWKTDDTVGERRTGKYQNYLILIDCESRQDEVLATLTKIVRTLLAKKKVWINGELCELEFEGRAVEIEPTDSYNIIPKVQYQCNITIKEEFYNRNYLTKFTTQNLKTYIKEF